MVISAFQQRINERFAANTKQDELDTLSKGAKSVTDIIKTVVVPEIASDEIAIRAALPKKDRLNDTSDVSVKLGEAGTEFIEDTSAISVSKEDTDTGNRDETTEKATVIKEKTKPTPIKFDFEDNILTKFDNVQYNLRLYMTSETTTHETLPFDDIIVIAETGSTGFNITDLQMDTIISPSLATKNSFATNVVIKIIEPFGSSLLDYIRNSAAELQVFDHRRVPIWLDIRFKGYIDGFDESFQGGVFADLNAETRTWQLRVKNIDIEMTKGGTEYTMHLIAQNEVAMEDSARLLESDIHIEAKNLKGFFGDLSKRLNAFTNYDTVIRKDTTENVRRYSFALPGAPIKAPGKPGDDKKSKTSNTVDGHFKRMEEWAIRGKTSKKSVKTSGFKKAKFKQSDSKDKDKWQITFKKGTSIESIIQQIIGSTDEGQSLLLFGEPNKKISSNKERNPTIPSIAFTVDPDVFLLSYNKIAKAYNMEITYHIRPYKTFIPTVTREHIESAQSKKQSKERLKAKNKVSKIRKLYNYMFTGENTEILDYKVELNSTWFISLPIFRGQDRNANAQATRDDSKPIEQKNQSGQITQTKTKTLAESVRDLRKKIEKLGDELRDLDEEGITNIEAQTQFDEAIEALRNQEIQAKTQTQIPLRSGQNAVNTLVHGVKEKRISLTSDTAIRSRGNIQSTTDVIGRTAKNATIRKERRKIEANKGKGTLRGSIFFAEDFDKFIGQEKNNKTIDENGTIINIGSQISPTTSTGESNIEGVIDEDRSFFSAAMNQVYGFKGQLITLDLEIRGDPYWLGEPNILKRLTQTPGFVDHTQADSLIVLTFKFPIAVDDGGDSGRAESYNGTGLYDLTRRENGFNGVYYITKVENSFSGGRFTQRLTGYVDPLTKEQDLLSGLKDNGIR